MAAGVLVGEVISFGDTLERLLEVLLVVMVGVALADAFHPRALLLGLVLFCLIRPLATMLCLIGSPTAPAQRLLMGWFGIRGIGSLYSLSYALRHRLAEEVERVIPTCRHWRRRQCSENCETTMRWSCCPAASRTGTWPMPGTEADPAVPDPRLILRWHVRLPRRGSVGARAGGMTHYVFTALPCIRLGPTGVPAVPG